MKLKGFNRKGRNGFRKGRNQLISCLAVLAFSLRLCVQLISFIQLLSSKWFSQDGHRIN